jgi:hypothetical protein
MLISATDSSVSRCSRAAVPGVPPHLLRCGAAVVAAATALLLAGCQGQVTVDLATDAPADRNIQQVTASITGLEFRKDDGTLETVSFNNGELVDLLDYLDGDAFRLFTNEDLPDGSYSGVRLTFDTDAADDTQVVDVNGNTTPLVLAAGNYADIDITVKNNSSSKDSVTLTLDLRQSLSFDSDDNEYTLQPFLRSVVTGDAGQITGTVNVTCPTGTSLATGGAVYLFVGDVTPDDRDGIGVEPYATTEVATGGGYALRFLPAGDYTLAVTCRGNEEDPDSDDDLDFQNVDTVRLDENENQRFDFTN